MLLNSQLSKDWLFSGGVDPSPRGTSKYYLGKREGEMTLYSHKTEKAMQNIFTVLNNQH